MPPGQLLISGVMSDLAAGCGCPAPRHVAFGLLAGGWVPALNTAIMLEPFGGGGVAPNREGGRWSGLRCWGLRSTGAVLLERRLFGYMSQVGVGGSPDQQVEEASCRRPAMTPGVLWAASIWSVVLLFIAWRDQHLPPGDRRISLESIAIVLALLGTHSIVLELTDAEAILRDPVEGERWLRGILSAGAHPLGSRLWHGLRTNPSHRHRGLFALALYLGFAGLSSIYSAAPVVTAAKTLN